jgi:hypothetical protein
MTRNKPRLQVALYARPKHPGTYHYALFITPKKPRSYPATKIHVKNTLISIFGAVSSPWRFERVEIPDFSLDPRLLVLVTVGKVLASIDELELFLKEHVQIYQLDDEDQVKAKEFNCVTWVKEAFEALRKHRLVSGAGKWDDVRARAVQFVELKRLEGRWEVGWKGEAGVPTLNVMDGTESVT